MKVRRFAPADNAADAPIADINTTPLIDVMLVLLIMFIITIPVAGHQVPLDLPQRRDVPAAEPAVHLLRIDASGRIELDGAALPAADLPARLSAIAAEPDSELRFSSDAETRYERFDEVLAAIRRAGITRLGMDNHRFSGALE